MKRKYIGFIFMFLLLPVVGYAELLDKSTAVETAYRFFEKSPSDKNLSIHSKQIENGNDDIVTINGKYGVCLYGINIEGGGWALVSAEDGLRPVLAYSEYGVLPDWNNMPLPMQDIILEYVNQVDFLHDYRTNVNTDNWTNVDNNIKNATLSSISVIVPNLLERDGKIVRWKQSGNNDGYTMGCTKIYNKYCPPFGNTFSPCPDNSRVGCTAVAIGQVMWYWQWPYYAKVPLTMLDSLGHTSGQTMHQYDWTIIPSQIDSSTNLTSVNMVASLLRDCGYASKMEYKKNSSGAYLYDAADALINNFGYSSELYHAYRPDSSDNLAQWVWLNKLKQELNQGRPIPYCGYDGESSNQLGDGHSYVLTGYNSADYFCVNWGYGYNYTVWVSLDAMNVNGYNYKYYQQAIFGVEPAPVCSYEIPSTQTSWETNLVELYHGNKTIQNKTYSSNKRGIIYSDNSVHFTGSVHFEEGSTIHIAIRNMYCSTTSDMDTNAEEHLSQPQNNKKIAGQGQNKQKIDISPNPANDIITITSQEQLENIRIYTITGQCVLQAKQTDINVSALSAGIYIVTATTTVGNTLQSKFVHR